MSFRVICVESPARISARQGSLVIRTEEDHVVPAEDITALLVEDRRSTITIAAMALLSRTGTTVFVCDEKHLPCATVNPFCQHSRQTGIMRLQESLSLPKKKQLWKQVVQAKIHNQAECLKISGHTGAGILGRMAETVKSGDKENVEAAAAAYYFKNLFGEEFTRDNPDGRNILLNYGYAIMRGHIARLICSYGFLPMKGIHHRSEQNAFNLADDFMEPFRPLVDLFVSRYDESVELTPEIKRSLANLLNYDMEVGGKRYTAAFTAEKLVQSFNACCTDSDRLSLPSLLPLSVHRYG